jgi:RNA polymerase sigma-70 factor (ECF subfamily)
MRTTDEPDSDERLARLFADHASQRAMEALFRRHLPGVYSLARRYFAVREDAEEAASETFFRVFRALRAGQFRGESSFKTWTLKIAANVCRERLRQPRLPTLWLDGLADIPAPTPRDNSSIYESISALPDHYRLVLTLCDIEGYSAVEAAAVLGRTLTATKSIHYRARRALRDLLDGGGEG